MQMTLQDPGVILCRISAEKQLSKYAEWTAPRAGMFLWLKLTQVDDSMDIFEELKAAQVVVVPGDPHLMQTQCVWPCQAPHCTHSNCCLQVHIVIVHIAEALSPCCIANSQDHRVTDTRNQTRFFVEHA